jgi:UDP-N-acetylmuramate dehydrogenase
MEFSEKMKIEKNISLKPYNTFGIDVKAKFFSEIYDELQLKEILSSDEYKSLPKLILGGGSNILLTKNFDGLALKISIPGIEIINEDDESVVIKAGAGETWHKLVLFCVGKNYGGIENLSLIPGTVGAAPLQNIGAYGQELKDVFDNLNGVYIDDAQSTIYKKDECKFAYRDSIFKNELKNKFIITYVTLQLSKHPVINISYGNVKSELDKLGYNHIGIKEVSDVITKIRQSKLPDPAVIGNAGSFFKNPEVSEEKFNQLKENFSDIVGFKLENGKVKVPAGWLIESCGWKGKKVGNTGSHEKQSLVLVNYGSASGEEVLNLAEKIKESVVDKFGIELKEEVNII